MSKKISENNQLGFIHGKLELLHVFLCCSV